MPGPVYSPGNVPGTLPELVAYIADMERKLQAVVALIPQMEVLHAAPVKPREGLLAMADGTDWNPGSGKGLYRYTGAAWVFVG